MLLEFTVKNHRAFAESQTLNLIAGSTKEDHSDRVVKVDGAVSLDVLTSAMVMGKNGGGKSSLVDAFSTMRAMVARSAQDSQRGDTLPWDPFKLDKDFSEKPTGFSVLFSMHKNVYQYEFEFISDRILFESLYVADRTSRFRKMFKRDARNEGPAEYSYGEALKGDKSSWSNATRENALFLSTAVQLNSSSLKEPFDWLTEYMKTLDAVTESFYRYTAKQCYNSPNKQSVINFLKIFDIIIDDIEVEEEDIDTEAINSAFKPEFVKKLLEGRSYKKYKAKFLRKTSDGTSVAIDFDEESTGSRALFGLAGPIFDTLNSGYCLIVDEISTSLHPLVLHTLVELFSNPKINRKRAQLVFTSHDTSLLRDTYFRRDQVWFAEKGEDWKSELSPLSDYSPRKGEALDRGYLGGRYGGVPIIGSTAALAAMETLWNEVDS